MDSQASVSSSTSTVPLDLIHDQDTDFVDEIDEVDRIYFGNIEINLRDDISYSDLNDEDDEDCESDKENIDSSTFNIGVECSEFDLCESEKQKHFLNQTCNCERLYNKVPCSKIGVSRITEIPKFYRNPHIFTEIPLDITEIPIRFSEIPFRWKDIPLI